MKGDGAHETIARLRQVLAGSGEYPRPLARLSLRLNGSLDLARLVTPAALAAMRAAAVLVPVLTYRERPAILLTQRAETLRHHQGQISFPGGGRDETDADFAAAALREAYEEVGLDPSAVSVIGYLDDYPTMTGYRITPVVGLVDRPFDPAIDPGEVAATFELPLDVLLSEGAFESKFFTREGIRVPFYELNHAGFRIWGATAGILWELRQKLAPDGPEST